MRLQQEMDRKKKEEDLRRQAERRGPSRHGSRGQSRSGRDPEPAPAPAPASYGRSDSPPIPTLRSQPGAGDSSAQAVEDSGGSSEVVDQLQAQLSTEFREISTILREGPCCLVGSFNRGETIVYKLRNLVDISSCRTCGTTCSAAGSRSSTRRRSWATPGAAWPSSSHYTFLYQVVNKYLF